MIKWARRVLLMWDDTRNAWATPGVAMPDWARILIQPLSSSQVPIIFKAASSICSPPNNRTKCCSPYVSGQRHWTCFPMANRGWSSAIIGAWPGFNLFTACWITDMACFIMVIDLESSWNNGSIADMVGSVSQVSILLPWYAAHEIFSATDSSSFSLTDCSHLEEKCL